MYARQRYLWRKRFLTEQISDRVIGLRIPSDQRQPVGYKQVCSRIDLGEYSEQIKPAVGQVLRVTCPTLYARISNKGEN